ncbi:MAG: hypothetical protein LM571_04820 [Desulfurococcaceae archaeon]|nr:hypothetical protein [Desulfurococcaceae archaeon]
MRVLSVDAGTSFIKAALVEVDEGIRVVDYTNIPIEVRSPEPLAYEHDPREVVDSVVKLLKHYSRFRPDSVSLSTYLFGFVAVDRELRPLTGILTWQDERATEVLHQLKPYAQDLYRRTGCPPLHIYTLPRLLWLRQRRRSTFESARAFLDAKSYLLSVLAGEVVTDLSTASGTYQLLNIHSLRWDDLALELAGVDESSLPRLAEGDTVTTLRGRVASEVGLEGVPLVLGVYDGGSMVYGLTGGRGDIAIVNLGTSAMVRTTSRSPVVDPSPLMRFQTYYLLRGTWLSGGAVNNGAVAVDYVLRLLYGSADGRTYEEVFSELSRRVPTEPRVISVPLVFPERLPSLSSTRRMTVAGLTMDVDRVDVVRGVVEGVLMLLALIAEAMGECGVRYGEVRVGGKLSQYYFVRYVLSNLLKTRVLYPRVPDAVHVGNSLLALRALGTPEGEVRRVIDSLTSLAEAVEPDPRAADIYSRLFKEFVGLVRGVYTAE